METSLRTLSVVAISTYLAAALLPCEPPSGWRTTAATSHAAVSEASEASDATSGSESDDHSHDPFQPAAGASNPSSRSAVPIATAEFKAKCPCGCDESRSAVGGGMARLGCVVPGVHVPRLVELSATVITGPVDAFFDELHEELDPVPI